MHKKVYGILLFLLLCITHTAQIKPLTPEVIGMLKKQAINHINAGRNTAVKKIITQLKNDTSNQAQQTVKELEQLVLASKTPAQKPTPTSSPAPKPTIASKPPIAKAPTAAKKPAPKPTQAAKPIPAKQADLNKQQQHITALEKKITEQNNELNNIKKQTKQKDAELKTIKQQLAEKDKRVQELTSENKTNKELLTATEDQIKEVNKAMLEALDQSKQCTVQLKEKEQKIETLEKSLAQPIIPPPPLPPRDHPPYVPKEIRPLPPPPTKEEVKEELSLLEKQLAEKKEQLTKPKSISKEEASKEPSLIEQIKQGKQLKPVDETERKPEVPAEELKSLEDVLKKRFEEKFRGIPTEEEDEEEVNNDNWED